MAGLDPFERYVSDARATHQDALRNKEIAESKLEIEAALQLAQRLEREAAKEEVKATAARVAFSLLQQGFGFDFTVQHQDFRPHRIHNYFRMQGTYTRKLSVIDQGWKIVPPVRKEIGRYTIGDREGYNGTFVSYLSRDGGLKVAASSFSDSVATMNVGKADGGGLRDTTSFVKELEITEPETLMQQLANLAVRAEFAGN